jgi:hypothetical protein
VARDRQRVWAADDGTGKGFHTSVDGTDALYVVTRMRTQGRRPDEYGQGCLVVVREKGLVFACRLMAMICIHCRAGPASQCLSESYA